jgi:hypothetical protein
MSKRDNEGHLILIKGKFHQDEISGLTIYAPNTSTLKKTKKNLMALRAQIEPITVIVGDLNTPLSSIDRSSRQNINKETSDLFHRSDQMDMVDIYRVFHSITNQETFFLQLM